MKLYFHEKKKNQNYNNKMNKQKILHYTLLFCPSGFMKCYQKKMYKTSTGYNERKKDYLCVQPVEGLIRLCLCFLIRAYLHETSINPRVSVQESLGPSCWTETKVHHYLHWYKNHEDGWHAMWHRPSNISWLQKLLPKQKEYINISDWWLFKSVNIVKS